MSRIFAYCRVSTNEQTTANQIHAIESAGYKVEEHRIVSETISGGVNAMERPAFSTLVNHKLEAGDTLVVLKLDRLGRDNIDVQQTITMLMEKGISVVSLDLPSRDLASAEGKLILQMFTAFAEFEKNRIKERTKDALRRAKKEGKKLGRPEATSTTNAVQEAKQEGLSQSQTAARLSISLPTVKRHWNKTAA
ncbi:recombinase family protein [Marinobacterium sediminicola]|uniref:Site-specific DNA recombinase n=1 Tax=Marinobacterium sediminicola TaxID=518898 RepID=A0ABY1S323_9GAMM|nr:recombinase family protein [Marinobacterium sediminicola]ULG69291.1 recombinase family protein [Marinobacterium sediminicola]SMR77641.1 Site-specific DNA recombinase [Marinobacterium sediminicola]